MGINEDELSNIPRVEMNSPVTHSECIRRMEELKTELHACIKDEQIDFKEALEELKEWVSKLEGKIDYMVFGVLFLALEGIVGLVIFIFTMFGGKL